jgi:hypothetical protein
VLRDSAAYGAHDWAQWRPRRDAALAVRGGCRAVALGGAQAAQRCVRALARTCEGAPSRRRRPRRAGPPSVPPHCQSMFVRPMRAAACAPSRRRCSICCTTRLWAAARRRERSARTARLVLRTTPAPRRGCLSYPPSPPTRSAAVSLTPPLTRPPLLGTYRAQAVRMSRIRAAGGGGAPRRALLRPVRRPPYRGV